MIFTAVIYPDDQTTLLVAECPELRVASQGASEAEAMENLREAVELYLEAFPQIRPRQATVRTLELTHAWGAHRERGRRRLGFTLDRQRGSHAILKKQTPNGEIGCVIPMHPEIAAGTLRSALKMAGINIKVFAAAL